jgi:Flp pilus assembly pilin Flp
MVPERSTDGASRIHLATGREFGRSLTYMMENSCFSRMRRIFGSPRDLARDVDSKKPSRKKRLGIFASAIRAIEASTKEQEPVTMKSNKFTKLIKDNKGATMVEYAILLFLILVVAAVVYKAVGNKVKDAGDKTQAQFN